MCKILSYMIYPLLVRVCASRRRWLHGIADMNLVRSLKYTFQMVSGLEHEYISSQFHLLEGSCMNDWDFKFIQQSKASSSNLYCIIVITGLEGKEKKEKETQSLMQKRKNTSRQVAADWNLPAQVIIAHVEDAKPRYLGEARRDRPIDLVLMDFNLLEVYIRLHLRQIKDDRAPERCICLRDSPREQVVVKVEAQEVGELDSGGWQQTVELVATEAEGGEAVHLEEKLRDRPANTGVGDVEEVEVSELGDGLWDCAGDIGEFRESEDREDTKDQSAQQSVSGVHVLRVRGLPKSCLIWSKAALSCGWQSSAEAEAKRKTAKERK
ncbi:hypothetical protein AKJ16_DCAP04123 [Drosera capensis]